MTRATAVNTMTRKARPGLEVGPTDYCMASAEVSTAAEMSTPTEVRAAPTKVASATKVAAAPTSTAKMAAAAAPTASWTVGFSETGREGRDRYHGQYLQGAAEKSCVSRTDHHGGFTPSLRAPSFGARAALISCPD
jgi:hypothetical protein